ncbi:hypothetical protein OPT61_g6336 [Boeremia exigua]|uniref:Uncharacterized protein n=1 Tax=Boeremia exigua TaxID=749465 RepID=A0ACC2I734_9PLEO|nr:hypothetical protein OPT61_g6336 [Boeremia exigua]
MFDAWQLSEHAMVYWMTCDATRTGGAHNDTLFPSQQVVSIVSRPQCFANTSSINWCPIREDGLHATRDREAMGFRSVPGSRTMHIEV